MACIYCTDVFVHAHVDYVVNSKPLPGCIVVISEIVRSDQFATLQCSLLMLQFNTFCICSYLPLIHK